MEVSLAFWRDDTRLAYDPGAPSVSDRLLGIRALREEGIPVVLRIDPLFPRSPLDEDRHTFTDHGISEPQTTDDLEQLVSIAREVGARHVVYSPAKIVQPRWRKLSETMRAMRMAYEQVAAPQKLVFRGGSWRLPPDVADARIVRPFLDICKRQGVVAKHCRQNLIETP